MIQFCYCKYSFELHTVAIRWAWYLTNLCNLSLSLLQQKYRELFYCASCYQNITKLLTLVLTLLKISIKWIKFYTCSIFKIYYQHFNICLLLYLPWCDLKNICWFRRSFFTSLIAENGFIWSNLIFYIAIW